MKELGRHTLREIQDQPQVWARTLARAESEGNVLAAVAGDVDEWLFTGCGSSYYLGMALAAWWQERTGQRALAVPASEILLHPGQVLASGRRPVLVAISRSGETTETVAAAGAFRARGAGRVIALGCKERGGLHEAADLVLTAPTGEDESVVMTRGFTGMLLAFLAAAVRYLGDGRAWKGLTGLVDAGPGLLAGAEEAAATVRALPGNIVHAVFLGAGPLYGLASEGMLKLKEMAYLPCDAYHPMEFRHGPVATVGPDTFTVHLVGPGASRDQDAALVQEVADHGGHTVAVAPPEAGPIDAGRVVRLPAGLSPEALLCAYLPALQVLAWQWATGRGADPDQPRHLSHVVKIELP